MKEESQSAKVNMIPMVGLVGGQAACLADASTNYKSKVFALLSQTETTPETTVFRLAVVASKTF